MTTFTMDDHIAAQPDTVARLLAESRVPTLDLGRPLVFAGIGTSLHACRVAACWMRLLTGGEVRPAALDAHDLALIEHVRPRDQVVVVSHRGTKRYPNEVLRRAAEVGASTIAITGQGTVEPAAETVLRTCRQEGASTHTESYTAALAVLARLACAATGPRGADFMEALQRVPAAMRQTLELPLPEAAVEAMVPAGAEPVLVTGTGIDAITAEEAALKLKEGTYRWAEGMHTEFALHGTPAVFRASTVAYLIRPGAPDGERDTALAGLLRQLGTYIFHAGHHEGADLRFAETHYLARPFVSLLPFQRLVSAVAVRVGSNPDLTRLEEEPWATAIQSVTL